MSKLLNKMYVKAGLMVGTVGTGLAVAGAANATGPDFTTLSGGIDFTSAVTAILAIALSASAVYLAITGAKKVLSMIRG